MEFSIRRVNALLKKEIKDFAKNMNVSIMCALPILISLVFSNVLRKNPSGTAMNKTAVLTMCVGLNLVMVASFVIGMLIAEEKEKNTLRTLMLSAVSPLEFLAGKACITFLVSEVNNLVVFFIIGIDKKYFATYMLITTLVVLSMILIGSVMGVFASNQMAMSVVGMPVIAVFWILPLLSKINKSFKRIAEFLPNYNMDIMLNKLFKGETIGSTSAYNLAVILGWIIIAAIAFAYTYNKRGLDR